MFAQYDKSMLVLKWPVPVQGSGPGEGRCEGRKPFGYYESEQAALERMQAQERGSRLRPHRGAPQPGGHSDPHRQAVARRGHQPHPHWPERSHRAEVLAAAKK